MQLASQLAACCARQFLARQQLSAAQAQAEVARQQKRLDPLGSTPAANSVAAPAASIRPPSAAGSVNAAAAAPGTGWLMEAVYRLLLKWFRCWLDIWCALSVNQTRHGWPACMCCAAILAFVVTLGALRHLHSAAAACTSLCRCEATIQDRSRLQTPLTVRRKCCSSPASPCSGGSSCGRHWGPRDCRGAACRAVQRGGAGKWTIKHRPH